jgi:hypothetical protein
VQLQTLEHFRRASRVGRVIAITDVASGVKAHRANCPHVQERYIVQKVIEGAGKNGAYFVVASLEEAQRELGAAPCLVCHPERRARPLTG